MCLCECVTRTVNRDSEWTVSETQKSQRRNEYKCIAIHLSVAAVSDNAHRTVFTVNEATCQLLCGRRLPRPTSTYTTRTVNRDSEWTVSESQTDRLWQSPNVWHSFCIYYIAQIHSTLNWKSRTLTSTSYKTSRIRVGMPTCQPSRIRRDSPTFSSDVPRNEKDVPHF